MECQIQICTVPQYAINLWLFWLLVFCLLRFVKQQDLTNVFTELIKKQMQLVLVVVPDKGDAYAKVKTAAEIHSGILTQCVKASTVSKKCNRSTLGNILLKVRMSLHYYYYNMTVPTMTTKLEKDNTKFNFNCLISKSINEHYSKAVRTDWWLEMISYTYI